MYDQLRIQRLVLERIEAGEFGTESDAAATRGRIARFERLIAEMEGRAKREVVSEQEYKARLRGEHAAVVEDDPTPRWQRQLPGGRWPLLCGVCGSAQITGAAVRPDSPTNPNRCWEHVGQEEEQSAGSSEPNRPVHREVVDGGRDDEVVGPPLG